MVSLSERFDVPTTEADAAAGTSPARPVAANSFVELARNSRLVLDMK
jgi:hypothetical protein